MDSPDITSATATELIESLQSGSVSSVEITQAFIERIKAVDSKVHAFLHLDEEDMLSQAKKFRPTQGKR